MIDELKERQKILQEKLNLALEMMNLHKLENELRELDAQRNDSEVYQDFEKLKVINQEYSKIEKNITPWKNIIEHLEESEVMLELIEDDSNKTEALKEVGRLLDFVAVEYDRLEIILLFKDKFDQSNAYLTIHAGAGGTESCDWASMLYRMYQRWVEKRGFNYSVIEYHSGEEAGIKSVSILIEGLYAYGLLKGENGVHRLVRISPFDANKKRHTSFASVAVTAEIKDDIEINIDPSDLRIDTFRASGAGGQHVNTTDSAVRITHLPTGIVVNCQAERSQHQNKEAAFKVLRSKLYEMMQEKQMEELNAHKLEKKKIEWGSQIRSYVFHPYNMVKDHRVESQTSNVSSVMDGEIDLFLNSYLKSSMQKV